jgi:Fibronectin type III domain/Chitobiase/beta-hexosaminidase C-terminal domain
MGGTFSSVRRTSALVGAAALAAGALGALDAVPASGSVGPAGLRPGRTITVIHNLDQVSVSGYPFGSLVTVRVVRDGVTVGSVTAPHTFNLEGVGLAINHGVEGVPARAGDCWDGHTPDIRPGDHIVVTDGRGRDEIVVDDVSFTGRPSVQPDGDVVVPFRAVDGNGTAIPLERLDEAEFRDDDVRYRAEQITLEPVDGGGPGEYQMRYDPSVAPDPGDDEPDPDDLPLTQDDVTRSLLGDGHMIGFAAPLTGGEGMMAEGVTDSPGPAPGCEAAPLVSSGVSSVTPRVVNQSNVDRQLVVRGFSEDASEVDVELRDADSVVTADTSLFGAAGQQTWAVMLAPTDLADLSGSVRVTALVDGVPTTITKTALRDVDAPTEPTVSLDSGVYRGGQGVTIGSEATDRVRYTVGDGTQPAPAPGTGRLYRGGEVRIGSSRTLKVVALDQAGNASPVVTRRYRILKAPSAPQVRRATAGKPGGRTTARARWHAPETDNGRRVLGYRVTALRLRANNSVVSRRVFPAKRPSARTLRMRLRPGRYAFRVQAVNALGNGPRSDRSNVVRAR